MPLVANYSHREKDKHKVVELKLEQEKKKSEQKKWLPTLDCGKRFFPIKSLKSSII